MALAIERLGWGEADFWMRLQGSWALAQETTTTKNRSDSRGFTSNRRPHRDSIEFADFRLEISSLSGLQRALGELDATFDPHFYSPGSF